MTLQTVLVASACSAFAELLHRSCPDARRAEAFAAQALEESGESGRASPSGLARWARRRLFRRGPASLERILELVAGGETDEAGRRSERRSRSDGARLRSRAYRDFRELHLLWPERVRGSETTALAPTDARPHREETSSRRGSLNERGSDASSKDLGTDARHLDDSYAAGSNEAYNARTEEHPSVDELGEGVESSIRVSSAREDVSSSGGVYDRPHQEGNVTKVEKSKSGTGDGPGEAEDHSVPADSGAGACSGTLVGASEGDDEMGKPTCVSVSSGHSGGSSVVSVEIVADGEESSNSHPKDSQGADAAISVLPSLAKDEPPFEEMSGSWSNIHQASSAIIVHESAGASLDGDERAVEGNHVGESESDTLVSLRSDRSDNDPGNLGS